jgi:hypothetical protein
VAPAQWQHGLATVPQLRAARFVQVWMLPDDGLERPRLQMLETRGKRCELMARVHPGN